VTGYQQPAPAPADQGTANVRVIDGRTGRVIREGPVPRGEPAPAGTQLQPATPSQQAPQQQAPGPPGQESPAMRAWRIKQQAYEAFPYSNQRTQRGQYERALVMDERRSQYKTTPEQKLELEKYKQGELNRRAELVAKTNAFRTSVISDNAMVGAIMRQQNAAQRAAFQELTQRMRNFGQTPDGKTGGAFPYTEEDKLLMQNAARIALDQGLLDLRGYRAGRGLTPQQPAGAPQPATQPATQPVSQPAPQPGQPQPPQWLQKYDLKTYKGEKPPQQLTPEEKQNWQWSYFEDGTGWLLVPRKAPTAPTPAPAPAPRSQVQPPLQSLPMMP
jgi:hypothetical protein